MFGTCPPLCRCAALHLFREYQAHRLPEAVLWTVCDRGSVCTQVFVKGVTALDVEAR